MSSGIGARVGWVSAAGMQQPSLHGCTRGGPDNAGASHAAVTYDDFKNRADARLTSKTNLC